LSWKIGRSVACNTKGEERRNRSDQEVINKGMERRS